MKKQEEAAARRTVGMKYAMTRPEITLYGLKNCDSCRRARRELPDSELIDLREHPLPEPLLQEAYAQFGEALLNRRSTTWRSLDSDERGRPVLDLLRTHPALMKRPLIRYGERLCLGWDASTRAALGIT